MGLWIPRIEWNDQSEVATITSGSPVLSAISSTEKIVVGMVVKGTGIPTGATVISKTVNSVTLSEDATSSTPSEEVEFFFRYDFQYPPTKDSDDRYEPTQTVTTSLSGVEQVSTTQMRIYRELDFGFVTQQDADFLRDVFYRWAYTGNPFWYYPDLEESEVFLMTLNNRKFSRSRQIKKHPFFKYEISISMKRVEE